MELHYEGRGVVTVTIIVILYVQVTLATSPSGFLSIDCGGNQSQHTDPATQLEWKNDESFNHTFKSLNGSNATVPSAVDSSLANSIALRSFRYFNDSDKKYCYDNLSIPWNPMYTSRSVLIRLMFLHGGAPILSLPISFDVYVGASLWDTIEYSKSESLGALETPKILEGVFFLGGSDPTINICLVPQVGIPFISSLELRELDPAMYLFEEDSVNREDVFLSRTIRWDLNLSCPVPESSTRYPADAYDRLWVCPVFGPGEATGTSVLVNAFPFLTSSIAGGPSENYVPANVMASGIVLRTPQPAGSRQEFRFTIQVPLETSASVYAVQYFRYLASADGALLMNNSFQKDTFSNINVNSTSVASTTYEDSTVTSNTVSISFTTYAQEGPIINAIEIYEKKLVDHFYTQPGNARLVDLLQSDFGLSGKGDQCLPVPHPWITCTPSQNLSVWTDNSSIFDATSNSYSIVWLESINLSHLNNSAKLGSENYTNPSPNPFANFFLILLTNLNITHSNINDETFQMFMINTFSTKSYAYLTLLDMTNNTISSFTSSIMEFNPVLMSVNLSMNSFCCEAPSFLNLNYGNSIQILNMSSNSLNAFPKSWESPSITDYSKLQVLDFSNNEISDLSLLKRFVLGLNSTFQPRLESVYLSNNKITGDFPSELYFSSSSSLKVLNMDQNQIGGVLNLSNWQIKMSSLFAVPKADPMVLSLLNNSIVAITPDITDSELQSFIDHMRNASGFNNSGILLGGNPYCKGASMVQQRYLCRSYFQQPYDNVNGKKQGSKLGVILGATFGGIFFFALSTIFLIVILKLRKQVQSLKQFQLELATKRVQPPLYSFQDLRLATRDFHEDNKLGSGAFGAVYKGALKDGSPIAVKLLFYDKKQDTPQLMDQFLNEVVLITGIKHKHLVQLQSCCIHGKKKILVYEFAENGDLANALWGQRAKATLLNWEDRHQICVGVARGLSYLHEEIQPRVIHRDIKAANILLDHNLHAKVADFGLAKPFQEEETRAQFSQVAGTRGYWAPEYVLDGQLTQKADVYSFGILLLEIVSGRPSIVTSLSEEEVSLKHWAEKLKHQERSLEVVQPALRDTGSNAEIKKAIDTALLCLKSNPKQRPTMSSVVFMLLEGRHMLENLAIGEEEDLDPDLQASQFTSSQSLMHQVFRTDESDDSDTSPLFHLLNVC